MMKNLLEYDFPEDLKELNIEELELLTYEIRDFLINAISKTGGHLASNLGTVELSIAVHKVFNCPEDKIIWDVGHQAYIHKILTGRASEFPTLRQLDGLSGFPKREESEYDVFNTGHSSTSISAALGFADAQSLAGEKNNIVAVIGDGALTGGQAYEGMNNAGIEKSKIIVILNDNEMSISENIGGMSRHLSKLRTSEAYLDLKKALKKGLRRLPSIYKGLEGLRDTVKQAIIPGVIFEELGFKYLGPIDGHDITKLTDVFESSKHIDSPVLIHTITQKGKGYKNAEKDPGKFHGIGPFDVETGEELKKSSKPSYSQIFGKKLLEMGEKDEKIVGITAAMRDATGLAAFCDKYPNRCFDVGIAEAHAVTFASGLAAGGYKPFVAIYSTFLQRAYDQIMMDASAQNLPVVFAIDRAGNVGSDGETHHGVFDISFLKHIPNLTVMIPKDDLELQDMMEFTLINNGPSAIRYPRGDSFRWEYSEGGKRTDIVLGTSETLISYEDQDNRIYKNKVSLWAIGKMVSIAKETAEILKEDGIEIELINGRFAKPLDDKRLLQSAAESDVLITMEDNALTGGFGESAASLLMHEDANVKFLSVGWPDKFIEHGDTALLMKKYKIDAESIADKVRQLIER